MDIKIRIACGVGALGCVAWMLVLLFGSPTIHYDYVNGSESGATITCQSIVDAGSVDGLKDADGGPIYARVSSGKSAIAATEHKAARDGIPDTYFVQRAMEADCARVNTAHVAYLVLLAVPLTVLAVLALLPPRERHRDTA